MLFKELCNLNMSWVYRVGFLTEPQFSKHTNIFQNCQLQAIKYLHYRVNNVCLVRNDEIFTVFLKILYGFSPPCHSHFSWSREMGNFQSCGSHTEASVKARDALRQTVRRNTSLLKADTETHFLWLKGQGGISMLFGDLRHYLEAWTASVTGFCQTSSVGILRFSDCGATFQASGQIL